MRHFILLLALLMTVRGVEAQDTASSASEKTHFIIGATYNSAMNYYGRVDSLKSKGFYPFVGLALANGLYVNATFVFIRNSVQSQYAATLLEGGYNFKSKGGSWAGTLSASRFFYEAGIDLVQSAIRETGAFSITNLNKVVDITLGADAKFSDHVDLGAQGSLDHIIRVPHIFGSGDVLVLDPSATIYAGTQQYTQTFLQQQHFLFLPTGETTLTKNSQQFGILAYELSMPVVYGYKKINILITPAYILPQHVLAGEMAGDLFYMTATVKLTL